MAPMTRSFSPGGVPTPGVAAYYERRAIGGVGLILTEGTWVGRPSAGNDSRVPRFHGDDALQGWKAVADRVHAAGGRIAPQLWHVGGNTIGAPAAHESAAPYESPSGRLNADDAGATVMSEADVADTVAAYAAAAAAAKAIGFDAVELHGAHGYLIDQFFWSPTNQRGDRFGGATIAERARFCVAVIQAVREAVGVGFPISLRISQWKLQDLEGRVVSSPAEMEAWLGPLADAGVDIFHGSQRRFWEPAIDGSPLNLAGWARKVTGRPSIAVGSVGLSGEFVAGHRGERSEPASLDALLARLGAREFDLVAVGRALLNDPDWLVKVRDGRHAELRPYSREDLATLY